MDIIHQVTDGSYNVIGLEDGMFWIQGNATRNQLEQLRAEIDEVLEEKKD